MNEEYVPVKLGYRFTKIDLDSHNKVRLKYQGETYEVVTDDHQIWLEEVDDNAQ